MSRVQIVENDYESAQAMRRLLELLGASVLTNNTGEAALREHGAFKPELMLIDIGLPDISGHAVARVILERGYTGRPYLVALSGLGQVDDIQRSIATGFDEHITKPAAIDTIKQLLYKVGNTEKR